MKKTQLCFLIFLKSTILLFNFVFLDAAHAQTPNPGDQFYFHQSNYPGGQATPSWGDKTWAPNGLAHDKDH